ncbi:serine/threonine-protein kinase PknK [Mycobacterium tuberculosis]|uniref:serine/threonine-protein kinase PknK n=1 Tax=Mycobacterium tuberculosis TaxID=1773 RepID=UPI00045B065D|nr:serine/threonine-protein kinase PknK [Mycobacterium tuberculosis]KCL58732.1 serine/threonine-protein kinase transcriptional regulator PknK [Mycobacterium tuberculosis TB_RSA169]
MTDVDPHATRRDLVPNIPAELLEAGFDNVEEIGRGGFGVVYRCVQPSLDRAVAVKVLSTDLDRDNLERFLREQRAMGRLSGHPHIVTVLQVGVLAGGRPFIVMPYHAKNSLETLIRRHGPLDWRETLSIGVKLAGALEAAHRVGTLHRDVKPGNILLTDYGEPQLTDFGIARIAGGFETATGVIAGSPAFTAPEVLEGASPTPASDVYSLGATLFCALTGHAAYERRSGERVIAQFLRITSQPIPDLRKQGLPADVAAAIERASVPTGSLVTRSRLTDILRAGGRRRLILIHAPSGFGKSTLAAQWREELSRDGAAVAWLTIDNDDNNEVWFLSHLLESIRRVRPTLAESLGHVLEEHGDDAGRYVLTSLIDEIHENDDRIAVVIDDWHRVSDSRTQAALGFLLDNGCHHLQLIVTSWSRAGLPVGRLRIGDELAEIDSAALRFDTDEAAALLNDAGGLRLPRADVQALTTSTDGWAAALRLAALSLRGGGDATQLLRGLSGASDVIHEFLSENVLDTLEPELREFLLVASVTERTCGGLASALAGITNGRAMLEEAEHRGLFLQRTEDDPNWFRFHQMFADFLHRRLERGGSHRVAELHRRASAWFAENGYLHEAVDHALAAGDPARAVDLVEQDETNLPEQSKMTTLLAIVQKLPTSMVVSRARLQLAIAWANILLQRPAPATGALNRFETALGRAELPEATQADLRAEADVLRAVAEVFADRVERVDDLLAEAMSRPDTLPPRVPGTAGNTAALAAICRFEFAEVYPLLDWAAPYQEMMGPFGTVYAQCLRGMAARNRLDIVAALQNFRTAFEVGTAVGAHSHAARLAGSLLAELLYETGDLAGAGRLMDESYLLGSEGGAVDYLAARYVIGARVKAAQGDHEGAADRLSTGGDTAVQLGLPRLAARINNERIRLGIALPAAVAADLLAPRTIPRDNGIATMTAELDEDSAVRLLSAGDSADRDQACQRAGALAAAIDGTRRPLAALQAQILHIETLAATGRESDARNELAPVATKCAELGLSRLLVDAGLA